MAGDFTLKLPASTRNRDHERRLHAAFSGFHIVTEGVRPETGRKLTKPSFRDNAVLKVRRG